MVLRSIQDVWRHNGGAAVVEYALLLAVIGAGLVFALSNLGAANNDVLTLSKAALGTGTFGSDSSVDGSSGSSAGGGSGSSAGKAGNSGSSGQSGTGSSEQGADTNPTKQPKKPKGPPSKGKKNKLGRGQPR